MNKFVEYVFVWSGGKWCLEGAFTSYFRANKFITAMLETSHGLEYGISKKDDGSDIYGVRGG